MNSHLTNNTQGKTLPPYVPKDKKTRDKWLEIFEEYKLSGKTQVQLAKEYEMSQGHMAKIIKWGMHESYESNDKTVFKHITLLRLEDNIEKLERVTNRLLSAVEKDALQEGAGGDNGLDRDDLLLHSKSAVRNIAAIMQEVRKTHESIGSLMGVMKAHEKNEAPSINILMPNVGRGTGLDSAKVVNG